MTDNDTILTLARQLSQMERETKMLRATNETLRADLPQPSQAQEGE